MLHARLYKPIVTWADTELNFHAIISQIFLVNSGKSSTQIDVGEKQINANERKKIMKTKLTEISVFFRIENLVKHKKTSSLLEVR